MGKLTVEALAGLPEIVAGDDLAQMIVAAASTTPVSIEDGDVVVIAQKAVSKSEGRSRRLTEISPSQKAYELAQLNGKDPRLVQVILDESSHLLREGPVTVARTQHGFVCANAGVDSSNAGKEGEVVLLPLDPDGSARRIRERIYKLIGLRPAVLISDSFGRPWRTGQTDVALGLAGLVPLDDWRGKHDTNGRKLAATVVAVADQVASTADLARAKDSGEPVVLVRGLGHLVTDDDGLGAKALMRERSKDLFP